MRSIVVDTGPLVALLSRNDSYHARVRDFLRESQSALLTTWPVLTEAWHLLAPSNRLHLMRWVAGDGVAVFDLTPDDTSDVLSLLEHYEDSGMDLADASLVVLASRAGISDILTVDRRDFDVYRLLDGRPFVQVLAALP